MPNPVIIRRLCLCAPSLAVENPSLFVPPPVLTGDQTIEEFQEYPAEANINGKGKGTYTNEAWKWASPWTAGAGVVPTPYGYDDMESYTADVDVNGLNGGNDFAGAYVAGVCLGAAPLGWTDFSDATVSSDINGQSSGDWGYAFIAR